MKTDTKVNKLQFYEVADDISGTRDQNRGLGGISQRSNSAQRLPFFRT